MSSIKQALDWGAQALNSLDSPRLDAELLLMHCLNETRAHLFTYPEKPLSVQQQATFEALVKRRQKGEPVAYLLGEKEFWSLELEVTPEVLIPRSETECLVELALEKGQKGAQVIDLGTGSGAIALALKHERPDWFMVATDRALESLQVARRNAQRHKLEVNFVQGHWLDCFQANRFDLVVSNPPYIDPSDEHLKALHYEPARALSADDHGYADLTAIIKQATRCLKPSGWLMMEHGFDQGPRVRQLLKESHYEQVDTIKDLAGLERVTFGQTKG